VYKVLTFEMIRKSLLFSAALFALAFALYGLANYYSATQNSKLAFEKANLQGVLQQQNDAEAALQKIKAFDNKYKHYKENRIIGEEDRLNWIEVMDQISKQHHIPSLQFKVDKRDIADGAEFQLESSELHLYKSKMVMTMDLLHEGDLLTIIQELRKNAHGLFVFDDCTIESTHNIDPAELLPGAKGSCTVMWYTVGDRDNQVVSVSSGN
jgi:hypothetical protein